MGRGDAEIAGVFASVASVAVSFVPATIFWNSAEQKVKQMVASKTGKYRTKVGGSGLGLSLVSKIIVDHGGTIECYSRDNKTYFNLNLPVTDINKNEITDYDIHKRLLIRED